MAWWHYLSGDTRRIAFEVIKTRVHERELSTSIGFSMLIGGLEHTWAWSLRRTTTSVIIQQITRYHARLCVSNNVQTARFDFPSCRFSSRNWLPQREIESNVRWNLQNDRPATRFSHERKKRKKKEKEKKEEWIQNEEEFLKKTHSETSRQWSYNRRKQSWLNI